MNKDVMIDAISAIDQKYIIEYVQYETKLGIIKSRKKKRTRALLISAACLMLTVCMLLVSLPLSLIVLGSEPVQNLGSKIIENVIFPLDQQPEDPKDPDHPEEPAQTLLQINWVEWKITEEFFNALGAGTDDSTIDKLQSMQGGFVGESMQDLGDFLERLYEYYMKHKDEIDAIIGETESESDEVTEAETEAETERETESEHGTEMPTEPVEPNQMLHSGLLYELLENGTYAVVSCETDAEHIEIPEQIDGVFVTEIENSAFANNDSLVSVKIPDTVIVIRYEAFYDCDQLITVNLPANLQVLGDKVFASCNVLQGPVVIPKSMTECGGLVFSGCGNLTEILLEDGLTQLFSRMFYGSAIKTITIPDSITVLAASAFEECRELEYITLPSGLIEIGDAAFHCCLALKEIEIPDGVEKIGNNAFFECHSLTELYIPDSVRTIGSDALAGCLQLKQLHLPSNLGSIHMGCIDMTSIENLIIPEGVKSIDQNAVRNCLNLIRVEIPKSVKTINQNAFSYLHPEVRYYYAGSVSDWEQIALHEAAFATGSIVICTDGEIVIE